MPEAAMPSPFFLDDFVVPKNAGNLEKKAFFAVNRDNPASFLLGYVSLNPDSRFIGDLNQGHLLHKPIEFPTQIYAAYALPQNDAIYQDQSAYEPELKPAIPYQADQQTQVKPYAFPLLKPEEFSMPKFTYEQSNFAPSYDMPKQAIKAIGNNFWQMSSFFLGRYEVKPANILVWNGSQPFIYKFDNQFRQFDAPAQEAPYQLPKTRIILRQNQTTNLELILEKAPKPKILFVTDYPINIPPINFPRPETKGIDSAVQMELANLKIYKAYTQEQPRYDTQKEFVDIGNSNFWMTIAYYKGQYRRQPQRKTEKKTVSVDSFYRRQRRDVDKELKNQAIEKAEQEKPRKKESTKRTTRKDYSTEFSVKYLKNKKNHQSTDELYEKAENPYKKAKEQVALRISRDELDQGVSIGHSHTYSNLAFNPKISDPENPKPEGQVKAFNKVAQDLEYKTGAKVAYIVMDGLTGEIYADRNADDSISAGSLPKIFIAKFILELSQQGKINLDDVLQLRASQKPKNFTNMEKSITIKEGLREMTTDENRNSNLIATALLEMIGIKRASKMLEQQGYHQTIIGDYFRPTDLYREKIKTSPRDTARAIFELVTGKGFDEYHHKITLEVLNAKELYPIGKDLDGMDKANVFGKKGQNEHDISTTYAMRGTQNGQEFNRIGVFIQSGINKRIVKSNFKTPAPGGVEIMQDHIDGSRQFYKMAQTIRYKPA